MDPQGTGGLAEAAGRLRSAHDPAARVEAARALTALAQKHAAGEPDLEALTGAAGALLEAFEEAGEASDLRRSLAGEIHDFIDIARAGSVRATAYPSDQGTPGGRWLDAVVRLIERSDFTVGRLFRQRAASHPDRTLFVVPRGEQAAEYTWDQVARRTGEIACGVLGLLGEDARVAICSHNRIEGALFDLACLNNGIFDTMIPANAMEAQLEHIVRESGARMLVVSGAEQVQRAFHALDDVPSLEWVVTLDPLPTVPGAGVLRLEELLERGAGLPAGVLEERLEGVRSGDVATTMYTSGTTGVPKGIQFSHLNLVSKRYARAAALPEMDDSEVFLAYLPLYHTFGRWLEMLASVHLSATYVMAENPSSETLFRHMARFHPTAMMSVPKKWIDLHRRITGEDEPVPDTEQVRRAAREVMGERFRWGLSAAGRLAPPFFRFFQGLGVELLSGYGMTEATGGITMTPPGRYVDDSIGKALPAIELGFSGRGELLLRGPYVTPGYTNPEDDAAAFREGWFCTGDIVVRDDDGYMRHVDRLKDIYKNASGRTLAPQRIEGLYADFPEVSRVFAVGDGREYVTLLIRPNYEHPETGFGAMPEAGLREYFRGLVASCNRFLAPFERVVNFAILDRDFSMERKELTLKGSFRRSSVCENFAGVMESMYASSDIERRVGRLRVRIPYAFLQHLGVTEMGVEAAGDGLMFRAVDQGLTLSEDLEGGGRIWIGNCCYACDGRTLDLDDWLRVPALWVGNAELTRLTGEAILLWTVSAHDRRVQARMVAQRPARFPTEGWRHRLEGSHEAAPSAHPEEALRAVDYLAEVMESGRVQYQEIAETRLRLACRHSDLAVRSRAFATLLEHESAASFEETAALFCSSGLDFLDEDACDRMAALGYRVSHWRPLRRALARLREEVIRAGSAAAAPAAAPLLEALASVADMEEEYYIPVRREMIAWTLPPIPDELRQAARRQVYRIQDSIRRRLGHRQAEAADPETGRGYTWAEVFRFEQGISPGDRERIEAALEGTELLREAVYLLHRGRRIDLPDLGPGSVWVSLTGTWFNRAIYHVAVRLASRERCDFVLYLNCGAPEESFRTDLRLMNRAAGDPGDPPLTPLVGGYWPEHGVASIEHVRGETLGELVRHMNEHPDAGIRARLAGSWRHLLWSALWAAFEFHRRAEGRQVLTGTLHRDVSVPLRDYDERTRVFSTAGWRPFESRPAMLLALRREFLERMRFPLPALAGETPDDLLYDGAMEAYGSRDGLAFLEAALEEATAAGPGDRETAALRDSLGAYIDRVHEEGYMPRALHFAIARYRAWARDVPEATVHARAGQLRQLQEVYRLESLVRRFPCTRLQLYAETVLADAPAEGRAVIRHALRQLREGADIKEVLGRLYRGLQDKLPDYEQQYFLARAAYPHLELEETAELVTTTEAGPDRAELVTTHRDAAGGELRIRPVAEPGELDALYRLLHGVGIAVGFTGNERLLCTAWPSCPATGGWGSAAC